mmetsp:Transcript_12702/g.22260  ORF Transcript_12702/g.22260 Transcript_12702/m.22260 type:complete len:1148 (-) Transcript_12702:749-4192(-)
MDTKDVVSCIAAANVNGGGVKGDLRHHHVDNAQDGSDTANNNNDSTNNNQPTKFVSARCPSQKDGNTLILVADIVCGMDAGRVAHAGDEVEAAAAAAATGDFGKRNNGDDEISAVATVASVVAAKGAIAAAAEKSSNEKLAQTLPENGNTNTNNQPTSCDAITPKECPNNVTSEEDGAKSSEDCRARRRNILYRDADSRARARAAAGYSHPRWDASANNKEHANFIDHYLQLANTKSNNGESEASKLSPFPNKKMEEDDNETGTSLRGSKTGNSTNEELSSPKYDDDDDGPEKNETASTTCQISDVTRDGKGGRPLRTAVDCENNDIPYHEFQDPTRKKIQANGSYEGDSAPNQRAVAAADSVGAATASDNDGDGNEGDAAKSSDAESTGQTSPKDNGVTDQPGIHESISRENPPGNIIKEDNGTENVNEDTNNDQTLNESKLSDEMHSSPSEKEDRKHEKQDGNESQLAGTGNEEKNSDEYGTKKSPDDDSSDNDEHEPSTIEIYDTDEKRGNGGKTACKGEQPKRGKRMDATNDPESDEEVVVISTRRNTRQQSSTAKQHSNDDENMTISALQVSMSPERCPERYPRRRRVEKKKNSTDMDDCLGEDEVQFIFSSSPKRRSRSCSTTPSKATRKRPNSVQINPLLRRSKRESAPPAKFRYSPSISSTVEEKDELDEESIDEKVLRSVGDRVHRSPRRVCIFDGCMKFKQSECDGYCRAHFNSLPPVNCDESVRDKHQEVQRIDVPQDAPKRSNQKSRKRKQLDVGTEEPEKSRKRKPLDVGTEEPEKSERRKKCSTVCNAKDCEKFQQTRRNGFCAIHFNKWSEKTQPNRDSIIDTPPPSTTTKISATARKGGRDGRGICEATNHFSIGTTADVQNLIQKGSVVMVKDRRVGMEYRSGGVARVTNISPTTDGGANSVKYDVSYILGGEEKGVDGRHLSPSQEKSHLNKPDANREDEENNVDEDDDFNFSELEMPSAPVADTIRPRRELRLDAAQLSSQTTSCSSQKYWRCSRCEDLNSPKRRRCSTCRHFEGETGTLESALLERTRYELLNGRDFWICTRCVIGIPSIKNPCAKCRRMISFVPLDIKEFEEFVRNQRERNKKKKSYEWQPEWQQKETELQEEWYEEGDGVRQQDLYTLIFFIVVH